MTTPKKARTYDNSQVHRIFEDIDTAESRGTKIAVLRRCSSPNFNAFLRFCFDRSLRITLPTGEQWDPVPHYTPSDAPSGLSPQNLLYASGTILHLFISGLPGITPSDMRMDRKKELFLQLLEGLFVDDAQILLWAKDRLMEGKYHGLDGQLVNEAFPSLIRKVYNEEDDLRELEEERKYTLSNYEKGITNTYRFDVCPVSYK